MDDRKIEIVLAISTGVWDYRFKGFNALAGQYFITLVRNVNS